MSYLFGKSVLRGKKVLFTLHLCCFSTYYIMYEYMSWHVLLASTVGMCSTDCIVPFFSFEERKFKRYGDRWEWGGERGGGG